MKQLPRALRSSRGDSAVAGNLRTLFAAGCIAAVAACTGQIGSVDSTGGGPSAGTGRPTTSSATGPSSSTAATGAGGGTGVTTGVGGGPPAGTDPGRVTLHRLNRVEYNNTVRDLLGTTIIPGNDFPVDDSGAGFDNMADVLTLSPVHLSLYQSAASALVNEALTNMAARAKLVTCDIAAAGAAGSTCARTVLTTLMPRAWRRAVTDAEIAQLMELVTLATSKGDNAEQGLKLAMQAMILSPYFIFRVELDPAPASPTPHPLSGYELASRLSYFLWSTMPDDQLLTSAKDGSITQALSAQVDRMLSSPKASALVENFAGQWLHTRIMDDRSSEHTPDAMLFPKFDDKLRAALKSEAQMMFNDVVSGALPLDKLLTADYTYANDRLAMHYGLPAIASPNFSKVSLAGNMQRGGFFSQGAFLTATSHPTRTSPVKRGQWVLTQLLCTEIPPPPADVDTQAIDKETVGTMRQKLEAHRAQPRCATCHDMMDPAGFGLENYDAIGTFRTTDNGAPVDASGVLSGNRAFSGAQQLAGIIAKDPGYATCVVKNLYTYALGREPQTTPNHMDPALLASLADGFRQSGYNFRDLVGKIATSPTFTTRRGDVP